MQIFFEHVNKEDVILNQTLDCTAFDRLSPEDGWYLKAKHYQQNQTDNNPYASYEVYAVTIGLLNAVLENNASTFKSYMQKLNRLNLDGTFKIMINSYNRPHNPYAPIGYQKRTGYVHKSLLDVIQSFQTPDQKVKQECYDLLKNNSIPKEAPRPIFE